MLKEEIKILIACSIALFFFYNQLDHYMSAYTKKCEEKVPETLTAENLENLETCRMEYKRNMIILQEVQ